MHRRLMQELKERLLAEKTRLQQLLASMNDELLETETASIGELSSYDQHTADLGLETFEREKDVGLRENTRIQLGRINDALQRMEAGEYGICEHCGRPIAIGRLYAVPATTLCIACKMQEEAVRDRQVRPVEEDVLKPTFSHLSHDGDDIAGFDQEDTWQALARFGTANTPQDIGDVVDYGEVYINADEDVGTVRELEGIIDREKSQATDWDDTYPAPLDNRRRRLFRLEQKEREGSEEER